MSLWTVTANRLADGGVAYLREDREWTSDLQEALVDQERGEAEARVAWAGTQEHLICDPYVLEVQRHEGALVPLSARERIRAEGPAPTLERLGYPLADEAERRQRKAG